MNFVSNKKKSAWTFVSYRGRIVPIIGIAYDKQFKIRLSNGTEHWIDKKEIKSIFWENIE
jgi:hypothetical protein